jgi:hypothetical protein
MIRYVLFLCVPIFEIAIKAIKLHILHLKYYFHKFKIFKTPKCDLRIDIKQYENKQTRTTLGLYKVSKKTYLCIVKTWMSTWMSSFCSNNEVEDPRLVTLVCTNGLVRAIPSWFPLHFNFQNDQKGNNCNSKVI